MKKQHLAGIIFFLVTAMLLFSGCASGDMLDGKISPTQVSSVVPTDVSTSETVPTLELAEMPQIAGNPYMPVSGTFIIHLPDGWNCSESGEFQVNCQSQEMDAEVQMRVTSTGYELTEESFKTFTHAEMVNRYADKKEYIEIERVEEGGKTVISASWRDGETYWEGTDTFVRSGHGIFHLISACTQSQKEMYANLFGQVVDSIQMFPEKLHPEPLYYFRRSYIAREAFFEITVPTSWGRFADAVTLERTVVEGFLSPDSRASVQVAVYSQGTFIEQVLKADKTREIMHELYGHDLDITHDKYLPDDGRERLAWHADRKGINGITYFDSYGSSLYVFSIIWENSTEALYLPVLKEIEGSFTRE